MDLDDHRTSVKDCRDILMSQTFADFEFHAQDRNATRGTHAPNESHATDGDRQRLEVLAEIVRQCTWRQLLSNLCRGLEVEMRMNMLVKTNVHHGIQFSPNLGSRMQSNGQDTFLQPTIEVLDRSIAPGFVF